MIRTAFAREFDGARLGDRRLEDRLIRVAELCRASPDKSFPDIAVAEADLTGLYRLLRSPKVTLGTVLEPHLESTAERCVAAHKVLVVHDTTECQLPGEARQDLGPLRGSDARGFFAHVALAIADDGSRRPLGILGAHTWKRDEVARNRRADGTGKNGDAYHRMTDKESARWWRLANEAQQRLAGLDVIHVMDREADAYHIVRDALDHEMRFVIRMARDRVLVDEDEERLGRTSEVLVGCDDVFTMDVPLAKRAPNPKPRSESARDARQARLAVTGTRARLARPNYDRASAASLEVNIACVREIDPPTGVEPVAWVLITSEPITTARDLRAVVEAYRARWLIEELFKALKTGCAFEKRQLESYGTLTAALGIFLPIAWHLLLLRHEARERPDAPAESVLSPVQIQVLRARLPNLLPQKPSAADILRAVAYLGGHFIKRPPGWLVLGRGLEKLLDLEAGWLLARGMEPQL